MGKLVEPAVIRRPIGSPANEARGVAEPSVAIQKGVSDLADRRCRDAAPGRHGGMLPARSDRSLYTPASVGSDTNSAVSMSFEGRATPE